MERFESLVMPVMKKNKIFFIRPEEIAELAAYLMSDRGELICGPTVVADGGDTAAPL